MNQRLRILIAMLVLPLAARAADDRVIFNRDVRPIMGEYCFACHGPDPAARKEGIRFDREEGFFGQREDGGPTVVKGNPEKSPLYQRIIATDPDDIMPPPKEHKKLKPAEIATLKKWIEQGAEWQAHWAFIAPVQPPVPAGAAAHPVDAFVRERLVAAGLKPSPEADRRTLARRVALDLTGLPPSPEEVEAFVNDAAPGAYEKLVDKLLASPRYGEHRARYWLDAARYADTHGLHFDNYREMWPYREWVIKAFNRNQRFDQFTIEQIAGDLLPKPTHEQLIATGFHRCNITTNEGGTIAEENLANYAKDRVETTSWVWLGLTSNCAACHDHKFDPITQKDFYSMSAFFRNTTQDHADRNARDTAPVLAVPMGEDAKRFEAIPDEIAAINAKVEERKKAVVAEGDAWLATVTVEEIERAAKADTMLAQFALNEGTGAETKGVVAGQEQTAKLPEQIAWKADGKTGPAVQVGEGTSIDLGELGDFEKEQAFTAMAWFFRTEEESKAPGSIVARMDKAEDLRGWDLFTEKNEIAVHLVSKWPGNALRVVTTDGAAKPGQWQHVAVTYNGSGKAGGVQIHVNGVPRKLKVETDKLSASIRTKVPFMVGRRGGGGEVFTGAVQDVRLYSSVLSAKHLLALAELPDLRTILKKPAAERTPEEKQRLLALHSTDDPQLKELEGKIAALGQEKAAIQKRSPVTHIQMEKPNSQPMARLLVRGQYDQPKDELKAGVITALHKMPESAPVNRLGLAQWLMAKENPLTARVTVNRFWMETFGTGLVKSAADFGIMSDAPSHPALLDWLAVDFRDNGWDMKRLMRLLVTSETYKQSAAVSKELLARDPDNRLLARGPRFRMDAEMVRDSALAVSGLLSPKIGGASVKPYQPTGVWEAVAMPESNTKSYKPETGEALYRRSLYTFWKRSAPPASLEAFNAPSRENCAIGRERTNTPLQALVTLNDTQFVEAARFLAQAAMQAASTDPKATLDFMARRVLSRALRPTEVPILEASQTALLAHYTQTPADTTALLAVGETKPDPALAPPQLAAWTMVASQLMNLDETLNK
jgi:mono/diheme cytochrome c family protein